MTATASTTVRVGVALVLAACGPAVFVPPPPSPQRVYAASELDELPEIVLTPPLRYPVGGQDGVVLVRLVVDSAGNPEPATLAVVEGADSISVAAARVLVLKTLFRPGRLRGRVVQAAVEIPVEFSAGATPPVTLHLAGGVYGEDAVEERPHLASSPTLVYPAPLLLAGISGRVVLEAVIDTTGRVEDGSVRVVESSEPRFNPAAREYIRGARFTPGRIGGRPVRVVFRMPVEFKLPTRD